MGSTWCFSSSLYELQNIRGKTNQQKLQKKKSDSHVQYHNSTAQEVFARQKRKWNKSIKHFTAAWQAGGNKELSLTWHHCFNTENPSQHHPSSWWQRGNAEGKAGKKNNIKKNKKKEGKTSWSVTLLGKAALSGTIKALKNENVRIQHWKKKKGKIHVLSLGNWEERRPSWGQPRGCDLGDSATVPPQGSDTAQELSLLPSCLEITPSFCWSYCSVLQAKLAKLQCSGRAREGNKF